MTDLPTALRSVLIYFFVTNLVSYQDCAQHMHNATQECADNLLPHQAADYDAAMSEQFGCMNHLLLLRMGSMPYIPALEIGSSAQASCEIAAQRKRERDDTQHNRSV